jgi:uncharacterized membrane protein YebE (DUF533 family)
VAPEGRAELRQAGLAGGAALGLAALLWGGRQRRGAWGNALLLGGVAALAKVATDAWARTGAAPDPAAAALLDDGAEARATTILLAMVAAAKADGHLDEEEESALEAELDDLPPGMRGLLAQALARTPAPEEIARRVEGGQEAREVYAASALLCGRDDPREVDFLDRFARALGIGAEEARAIEADVLAAV